MLLQQLLSNLHSLIVILIFVRVVISFFPRIDNSHPLIHFIYSVTEPILAPFRNILPTTSIGVDFSPLLALLVIDLLFRLLFQLF